MANNYTQFSFELNNLKKSEIKWLKKVLALSLIDGEPDGPNNRQFYKTLDLSPTEYPYIEYWPDFDWRIEEENKTLWIYSDDSSNIHNATVLTHAFLKKFRPKEVITIGVAFTCSKPRVGGFGGVLYSVNKDGVYDDNVGCLIAGALRDGIQRTIRMRNLTIIVRKTKR